MDDRDFARLLAEFDLSWAGYRKVRKGAKKRVRRHMEEAGCRHLDAYLELLRTDATARAESRRRLAVTISRFFRDRVLWGVLETVIFPDLLSRFSGPLKVWSAGCACGEEAYSIRMVWEKVRETAANLPAMQITATDRHRECLARAGEGTYPLSSLKELTEAERRRFFAKVPGKKRWAVRERFRSDIQWRAHDLLTDAPPDRFQVIFLRNNLMTYYGDALKVPAFRRILDHLVPSGYLILGTHETLPQGVCGLRRFAEPPWVYRKAPGNEI